MKPLSRAFARLVLLCFALGIFFLAVNELIPYRTLGDRYRVMDTAYWIKNTLRITGIVLLVNGGIQWVRNLRCPYCGRELAPGGSGVKATKGPTGSQRAVSCPAFC